MTAAGVSLTADQRAQVEALYAEESQARFQLLLDSAGGQDPAKLNQLETQTSIKIVRLLTADQRKALAEAMAKARGKQP